jgi:hypothetical protein
MTSCSGLDGSVRGGAHGFYLAERLHALGRLEPRVRSARAPGARGDRDLALGEAAVGSFVPRTSTSTSSNPTR